MEDGWIAHVECDVCGAPNEDYELYAAGDAYRSFPEEDRFVYQAPTCTEQGLKVGYCEYCDELYGVELIPATGHADEDTDGVCDVCEEEIPAQEPEQE